jgi:phage terminase small subunit
MALLFSIGVDTSLISEVSEGKDGIKFKLADKMKAMDMLAKLSNLLSDEEKTRLELEYMQLRNNKVSIENKKATGEDLEIEDTEELENEIYGDNQKENNII